MISSPDRAPSSGALPHGHLPERQSPTGQELLAEFVTYGHQRPYEEIVRRYAGMVFNVCLRVTKDKHDAEDATQAVFLTLALHAKKGTEIRALGPWLQQVGKRLSLDLRRSKKRRKTREERHQFEQTSRRISLDGEAVPSADLDEIKAVLHDELQRLPSKYRLPLILHYFGGLSREEMAVELGCKPSTLGVRIFRGRAMLAGRLNGRGINFTPALLPLFMGQTVHSAVSHSMVHATSNAAAAMAAGYDGIGLVSSRVISLVRHAMGAAQIGKVKALAMAGLMVCAMLGTGAKALGMLPQIDIQRIIVNQVERLVRPLLQPVLGPMQANALTVPPAAYPGQSKSITTPIALPNLALVPTSAVPTASPTPAAVAAASVPHGNSTIIPEMVAVAATASAPSLTLPPAEATAHPAAAQTPQVADADSVDPSAASDTGPGHKSEDASATHGLAFAAAGGGGLGSIGVSDSQDLYLPPATSANISTVGGQSEYQFNNITVLTTKKSATAASAVVRIASDTGLVRDSNGVLQGWGKIDRTGTLNFNGQVIADGQGVDRTLDLSSFQLIKDSTANPASGTAGWYAQDQGRLTLGLLSSSSGYSLNWGADPTKTILDLVNSVRIKPLTTTAAAAVTATSEALTMSLLATDRADLPSLTGIEGTAINLWEVGSGETDLPASAVTIRYDDAAVQKLAADESDVQLWTCDDGSWQSATNGFSLDTADHLVSATVPEFSYLAVVVGADTSMSASPSKQIAYPATSSVPEPASLAVLSAAGFLLMRRRHR